ncbi:MAG: hypothetical protein A2901_00245 [Elusimicrobia bacterium RIFCSPLOWO2_01_FULL_54_10]|nr:MAG: hypothetical protein A2901_00245 [Elusimicrobia bacterium RIFCSPLOWO2_01_FULL_54_10]
MLASLPQLPTLLRRMSVSGEIRKIFQHKLTIMVVPHNALSRFQFRFSFSFFIFLIGFSVGMFSWAVVAVTSNIDYWSMKVNHEVLKLKVQYFATELRKNREMLEGVQEADLQLRKLLRINDRQKILDGELAEETNGQGGPEPFETTLLEKALDKTLWTITESEIRQASRVIRNESASRLTSFKEISEFIAYERGYSRSCPLGWPAPGRLTSHYGHRVSPMRGGSEFHMGIDIANEKGTPVRATADGTVLSAGPEGGYGRLVIIDHGFGFRSYYGHNSVLKVQRGQLVRRGQVIAEMGSTGSSTGNHAHYEVWQYGRPIDPWKFASAPLPIRTGDVVNVAKKVGLGSTVGLHNRFENNTEAH